MKPLKLEDLKPAPGKFFLRKFDREFTIRIPTIADEAWLRQVWGDKANEMLRSDEGMCRFVFQLLIEEDKAFFPSREVEHIDENGETVTGKLGGWKAFMASVESAAERYVMAQALLHSRGFSQPILDEIVAEEIKKKAHQESLQPKHVGEKFSTSSQVSTDGPGSKSSPGQGASLASHSNASGTGQPAPLHSRQDSTASKSKSQKHPLPSRQSSPKTKRR